MPEDKYSPKNLYQFIKNDTGVSGGMGNDRVNWIRGGMGCFKVLPVLAGLLTAVQMLPATNGTMLYHLIMTPKNMDWADS